MFFYFLIVLNILVALTLIPWFGLASRVLLEYNSKVKNYFRLVIITLSYGYPFLIAFCGYTSWSFFEKANTGKAILYAVIPLFAFAFGFFYLKKR